MSAPNTHPTGLTGSSAHPERTAGQEFVEQHVQLKRRCGLALLNQLPLLDDAINFITPPTVHGFGIRIAMPLVILT